MSQTVNLVYVSSLGLTISNGTTAGTHLIVPVSGSFAPAGGMATLNGDAAFAASTSDGDNELWTSNGFAVGTSLITTLAANLGFEATASINGLTTAGDNVVFDYTDGSEAGFRGDMWVTNGTAAGTVEVPGNLLGAFDQGSDAELGNELVFNVIDGGLAVTDGTVPGTQILVPFVADGFTVGDSMASLGTSVVFSATSNATGRDELADNELWTTDGTAAGTSRVVTLPDNADGNTKEARISGLTPIGTVALFRYDDGSASPSPGTLWVTNGTAAGTFQLPTITAPFIAGNAGALSDNGYVFSSDQGLDVSDGTVAGTKIIVPEINGPDGFIPTDIMASLGGDVVFAATSTGSLFGEGPDTELWITDGTAAGTRLISTLVALGPDAQDAGIASMTSVGDKVMFAYGNGAGDSQVWTTDGTTAGTTVLQDNTLASFTPGAAALIQIGTATGDVHMATYDSLHYDFQADGAFILTRSTVPGDDFQIQIQTAPVPWIHALSYATELAAQDGFDVVTFAINRASTVWVDGTPDTTLTAADPMQRLAGGQLEELSPSSFQLTWTTGQTLTITDQGLYLDSSVGLTAANGPGSVQGLLGSDSGQANDFQLPDGSIIPEPLSGSELYGTFANAWTVTPATSLLDGAATGVGNDPTAPPIAIGKTAAGTMQFIYANDAGGQTGEQIALQATTPGQILTATSGVGVVSDPRGVGATFRGTLSELANVLISGFSAKDLIDVNGLVSATVSASYAGSASAGVLSLIDGAGTGELYLSGQLAGGSFHVTSDAHGGTQIAFS